MTPATNIVHDLFHIMSDPATPSGAPDAPSALDRARARIEPQMALLERVAEIGLDVCELIGRQARGEEAAAGRIDLGLADLNIGMQSSLEWRDRVRVNVVLLEHLVGTHIVALALDVLTI